MLGKDRKEEDGKDKMEVIMVGHDSPTGLLFHDSRRRVACMIRWTRDAYPPDE